MKMPFSFCVSTAALLILSTALLIDGLAVVSVDFGNEYMKIAIVKPGVPMEIVLNKESTRKTPSVVTLKDGERLVGDPALNAAIRYPKNGYRYLLDVLGKHFDNPLVELYRQRFPFYDLEKDPETGTVLFKHEDGSLYSPEVLVSMILQKAKEYAEAVAEQPINEAVITIPAYFNQAERRAMARAAELAGFRLLQLISDNTAVALNYGVFRRKIFNTTAINYMFFDIGASGTTASVVSYQVVKVKSPVSGVVDTFPQLTIKGVGFDRTLGGMDFQLRLRDYLAQQFNQVKKSKKDMMQDYRALQKLFKEAGRVKQVLSANADHFAQVESLFEDEDFRVKVTREEFEGLCQDLIDRVGKVVRDALTTAQMSMDDIEEVILMGGGTRIPKVQQAIMKAIGREELGKGINTDEAAALGAVYQAANLGKGFKVKKFGIKDATIYPIQVEFERVRSADEEVTAETQSKTVKRVLFGRMQSYPQKKVMTFNKHTKDFSFEVAYGDLSFLSELEIKEFGLTDLQTVSLTGVESAYKDQDKDAVPKGIKAHFRMDDSGLLFIDKVEVQFEKTSPVVSEKEESTLSKIGNTISNLFGGNSKVEESVELKEDLKDEDDSDKAEGTEDSNKNAEQSTETEEESVKGNSADDKSQEAEDDTKQDTATESKQDSAAESKEDSNDASPKADTGKDTDSSAKSDSEDKKVDDDEKKNLKLEIKEAAKNKTVLIKADIKLQAVYKDLLEPSEERIKVAKKLLADMKKVEDERQLLAKTKNEIESFVFDTQDKLEQRDYKRCSTEDERVAIQAKLTEANDWLFEQEDDTPRKVYEDKLKELKAATRDVFDRVKELTERPAAVEAFNGLVNHTEHFLKAMKNFTGEDLPFTQVEYDGLDKLLKESREWNKTVHIEQSKTALTEKPKFTVEDVSTKMAAIDRELKYLINKMKLFKPKPKPKPAKNATTTEESSSSETKTKSDNLKTDATEEKSSNVEADNLDRDILDDVPIEEDGDSQSSSSDSNSKRNSKSEGEL